MVLPVNSGAITHNCFIRRECHQPHELNASTQDSLKSYMQYSPVKAALDWGTGANIQKWPKPEVSENVVTIGKSN